MNARASSRNLVLPATDFRVYVMAMVEFISVHITASSRLEAEKIGRTLVEERLAACANVLEGVHSIFRWEGKIEEVGESLLIVKTRADLFEPLRARVKVLHSYTTPCIVAEPIVAGEAAFLGWVSATTQK